MFEHLWYRTNNVLFHSAEIRKAELFRKTELSGIVRGFCMTGENLIY